MNLIRPIIAAVCISFLNPIAHGQWPQYGGVNRNFRGVEIRENDKHEPSAWSLEMGLGDAPPIVHQNRIYVTEASFTEDGQEAMQVRCVEPVLGTTIWNKLLEEKSYLSQDISNSFPVRPLSSPIAAADRIVVISYGGVVTCLDQRNGEIAWVHDLVKEFQATPMQFGWASSPWTDGEQVIVACGGPEAMVISFSVASGDVEWKTAPGEAAYGSFSEIVMEDGSKHLCYVGRDKLFGFDANSGRELWSYPLPKPTLTNTVTPVPLQNGELLVAGQGFDGSRKLKIKKEDDRWAVDTIWVTKQAPFYCNWVYDQSIDQVIAYNSNVLAALDGKTGETAWKSRGWTDANFAFHGGSLIGIRGDGYLVKSQPTSRGMQVIAGARVVNDRVWAPPVIVGNSVLIRGRTTLSSIHLESLSPIEELPAGTAIDSMNAMYGEKNEQVVALLDKASRDPDGFQYADYTALVKDRSVRFGESEYKALFSALEKSTRSHVADQIAEDWCQRDPESIVAFDKLMSLKRGTDHSYDLEKRIEDRSVSVQFEVTVPEGTEQNTKVYLTGNAIALSSWKADGVFLSQSQDGKYRAQVRVPRGYLEFKVTCGDWESVEVRSDGRSISNRRRLVVQPTSISLEVQAWKNKTE